MTQKTNNIMTKETIDIIHRCYNDAVKRSHNILEIVENLCDELSQVSTISDEDALQYDAFLKGVHTSKMIRRQTFKMTNLVCDIIFVMMYIVIWLNSTKNAHIDINLNARRKSLESELSKLLEKSYSKDTASIHDRFGIRGIMLNKNCSTKTLFYVFDSIIDILSRKNRKEYSSFISWIDENYDIDNFTKERIKFTLNLPFKILSFKDYVNNPNEHGYQSLHCVIGLEMYSEILPGAEVEIQFRTNEMHQHAENGAASHKKYEEERRTHKNVFCIDDFSSLDIVGLTSYNSCEDDIDGVHFGKLLVNRRISSTLV